MSVERMLWCVRAVFCAARLLAHGSRMCVVWFEQGRLTSPASFAPSAARLSGGMLCCLLKTCRALTALLIGVDGQGP